MKKLFGLLSLLGVLCVSFASCEEETVVPPEPTPGASVSASYTAYISGSGIEYFEKLTALVKNPSTGSFDTIQYEKTDSNFIFKKDYDDVPSAFTQDSLEMYTLMFVKSLPSIETDLYYGFGAQLYNPSTSFTQTTIDQELIGIEPDGFITILNLVADDLAVNHIHSAVAGYVFVANN
ncbi:MAG: hypothetical protein MJY71_04895 [Bacteroidaceae bacterium]|nr:hypothetical protein [Bacteroidaceae bacterium]